MSQTWVGHFQGCPPDEKEEWGERQGGWVMGRTMEGRRWIKKQTSKQENVLRT